jgi:hypothetical protein
MSLDKFVLDILREFDIVHKKKLKPASTHVQVDLDRKKIYLRKEDPGYGKDVYLLYGIATVYYRYYNRKDAAQDEMLELAKKWYSQIYSDLEMTDEE